MKIDLKFIKQNGMKFGTNYYLFKNNSKYFLYNIDEKNIIEIKKNIYKDCFKEDLKKLDRILRKRKLKKLLS